MRLIHVGRWLIIAAFGVAAITFGPSDAISQPVTERAAASSPKGTSCKNPFKVWYDVKMAHLKGDRDSRRAISLKVRPFYVKETDSQHVAVSWKPARSSVRICASVEQHIGNAESITCSPGGVQSTRGWRFTNARGGSCEIIHEYPNDIKHLYVTARRK